MIYAKDYLVALVTLSVVGAGHARDEGATILYCGPNVAGMARSYGDIVFNIMAVVRRNEEKHDPL